MCFGLLYIWASEGQFYVVGYPMSIDMVWTWIDLPYLDNTHHFQQVPSNPLML